MRIFLNGEPYELADGATVDDAVGAAGAPQSTGMILRALKGHAVNAHALTHAHPDHQGASKAVCERFGIPFWVPELDVPAAEDSSLIAKRQPNHPIAQISAKVFTGPSHPVDRALHEGDEVASFRLIHTPGHSLGHMVLWREEDRVLIIGDVLNNQHPLLGYPGLRLPLDLYTPDPATNRASAKKLGELEPRLVLFGHGAALRDTRKFVEFCAGL